VGANYRAVGVARSKREFIAKLGIVLEEADETVYWLRLLVRSGVFPERRLKPLMNEAMQLVAIFAASAQTARRRKQLPKTADEPMNG
jgi:four helix bundle protein